MATLSVPTSWEEITGEWMTAALADHHPDVTVDGVTVQLRDDGTNRRARLALSYAQGSGPATVFAKAADPDHKELIRMTSGMFHEPRLFMSGADLALEHPIVYTAVIDESAYDFVMVMEDLAARGADLRDSLRPLTVEQAGSGVRALGRMHGRYWGQRVLQDPKLDWLEPFVAFDGLQYAPLPSALERLDGDTPPEVMSLSIDELVESVWKPYIRTLTTSPQTLLHGDAHIGNTYVTPGNDVGFLDWQMARRGNWSLDIGYFLQGALTTEDRRAHEGDLLEQYRDSLALPTGESPSLDEVWTRYRASVAHGLALWLCTASAGGELWQQAEVAVTLAQRYANAYGDLQTPAAIADIARSPDG